jgi:putative cardiolipin synthase
MAACHVVDSVKEQLDIQYFIWRRDDTGALLLNRVLKAADRGVKVRILMDDFDSVGWNDGALLLNLHPNIEFKVFNPFKKQRGGWAKRGFELVTNFERLNHRMHNKLMIGDNTGAIVGGRNVGNEYFGAGKKYDFRDYDLIANGPVVQELSESFDVFWNAIWSYPIDALSSKELSPEQIATVRKNIQTYIDNSEFLKREFELEVQDWSVKIAAVRTMMIPGPARAVFDCPPPMGKQFPVQARYTLNSIVKMTTREILLISPYIVPLRDAHKAIREIRDKGVIVKILTNSLAAADHTIAFSGYATNRDELLANGVIIHELKPDAASWKQHRLQSSEAKHLSLHAKVMVFDRRWVFVGSLNLDPRAVHWNTELGLLIDSEPLAQAIYRDFAAELSPDSSWQVKLRYPGPSQDPDDQDGPVKVWIAGDTEITREPARSFFQRMSLFFYSLFPLEKQL